jgi:Holliday junction DNA helicase RuvA
LEGKVKSKGDNFVVVELHGIGLKVFTSKKALSRLGDEAKLFTHLHVREDALDLFGLSSERELKFFEQLISISGVGPKSALSIMDVAELEKIIAAIKEGRPDLLTEASGIGRKTAERIIIELRGKVTTEQSGEMVKTMESDSDILETLISLGYKKDAVRSAMEKAGKDARGIEARLKATLKILSSPR